MLAELHIVEFLHELNVHVRVYSICVASIAMMLGYKLHYIHVYVTCIYTWTEQKSISM